MSARQIFPVDATAFQIAALLEQYESDIEALVSPWLEAERYARVRRQVAQLRLLCASQPHFTVPWLQLLVAHTELMHIRWRCDGGPHDPLAISRCTRAVRAAADELRARCLLPFRRAMQTR